MDVYNFLENRYGLSYNDCFYSYIISRNIKY